MSLSTQEHFKDFPTAIFKLRSNTLIESVFHNRILTKITDGLPLSNHECARLRWYPHLVYELLKHGDLSEFYIRKIVPDSPSAFYVLCQDYQRMAPLLEHIVIEDTEYVEKLIAFRKREGVEGFTPNSTLIQLISNDPNRVERLFSDKPSLINDLRERSEIMRFSSAEWAWYATWTSDGALFEDRMVRVLLEKEEYAFRAALWLSTQGNRGEDLSVNKLLQAIESPRWAYHALGVPEWVDFHNQFLDILGKNPPWLVEHIEDREVNGSGVVDYIDRYIDDLARHECRNEFIVWSRTAVGRLVDREFKLSRLAS